MARKKKTTNKPAVQEELQDFEVVGVTPAVEEKEIPAVQVEATFEADETTPTEEVIEKAEIVVKTAKQIALEEFANFWNGLPHHQYISDKEARYVHSLWQTATGRTDYYSNCSICTINHIKQLKKLCKNEGIELKK